MHATPTACSSTKLGPTSEAAVLPAVLPVVLPAILLAVLPVVLSAVLPAGLSAVDCVPPLLMAVAAAGCPCALLPTGSCVCVCCCWLVTAEALLLMPLLSPMSGVFALARTGVAAAAAATAAAVLAAALDIPAATAMLYVA